MALNAKSKYPSRRAYVLKVSSDATPDALAGCLENMVSGRKLEFASGRELLDAIAGELRASADERSDDATGDLSMPERLRRSEWMNTKQDLYQVAWWERNLEEIDREVARLALLCRVSILDPGVIDRVLQKDMSVCGADNKIAFQQAARPAHAAFRGAREVRRRAGAGRNGGDREIHHRAADEVLPRSGGQVAAGLSRMDTTLASTMLGLLASLVGASGAVAIAWITQRTLGTRELIREEMRKREMLYGEFIAECGKLLVDALAHTLEKPETLVPAYAMLNRIRLSASHAVLAEAERLLRRITEQYFSSNLTVDDLRRIASSQDADPLKAFGEACREELKAVRSAAVVNSRQRRRSPNSDRMPTLH